jgi:hypothetical protein
MAATGRTAAMVRTAHTAVMGVGERMRESNVIRRWVLEPNAA